MTVKLVVLYTQPDDPDVFERHYAETHLPMVHQIPGFSAPRPGVSSPKPTAAIRPSTG